MIEFASEEIRRQFHLLPIDRQLGVHAESRRVESLGFVVVVEWADSENSELTVRIDKKFDPVVVPGGHVSLDEPSLLEVPDGSIEPSDV